MPGEAFTAVLGLDVGKWNANLQKAGRVGAKFGRGFAIVGKKVAGAGKRIAGTARGIAKGFIGLPGLIAGAGIVGLAKNFSDAASDFEETKSKFDAVFKDQAIEAEKWADNTRKAIGRGRTETLGFLATLQDTFVPLGFARDKAAELSKEMTTLAFDLASFNNTADDESIRDLQSAIVGNHETMRKYGVIITETTLEQELFSMGLLKGKKAAEEQKVKIDAVRQAMNKNKLAFKEGTITAKQYKAMVTLLDQRMLKLKTSFKGGATEATEQEKVMARLSIIMRSTTDAQGDAIRTADSHANRMKKLKAGFEDIKVEIGEGFNVALADAIEWLGGMDAIMPRIQVGLKSLTLIANVLAGAFAGVAGAVLKVVEVILFGIKKTLSAAAVAAEFVGDQYTADVLRRGVYRLGLAERAVAGFAETAFEFGRGRFAAAGQNVEDIRTQSALVNEAEARQAAQGTRKQTPIIINNNGVGNMTSRDAQKISDSLVRAQRQGLIPAT